MYGEGGALITNDASIARRVRSLRDHAQSQKYLHDEIGYNYRMDSFQGAVLSIKLKHLDEWNAARIDCARQYTELLKNSSYKLPAHMSDSECVWHCYVIETPERDRVRSALQDVGIQSAVHYPVPVHLQKAYAHLDYRSGDLPVTEALCEHCLSLPIYPELSQAENVPCRFRSPRSGESLTRQGQIRLRKNKIAFVIRPRLVTIRNGSGTRLCSRHA